MAGYICRRCGKPVKNEKDYEVFEKMHWICFHLEFEHGDYDPDEPCRDPGCPWNRINNLKDILKNNNITTDEFEYFYSQQK
jgi:hypothetical protein